MPYLLGVSRMKNGQTVSDPVTLDTRIEDLVERKPGAIKFLLGLGVRSIRCGEPVWSTLGELLDNSDIPDQEDILRQLNALAHGPDVSFPAPEGGPRTF